MNLKLKVFIFMALIAIPSIFLGKKVFRYFTFNELPKINVLGVEENKVYKDKINYEIQAISDYKIAQVKASLNNTKLEPTSFSKIGENVYQSHFEIDTKNLANEKYLLEISAQDSSFAKNKATSFMNIFVDNTPLSTALVKSEFKSEQGKTVKIELNSNKKLAQATANIFSKQFNFAQQSDNSTNYVCFIPIDCEEEVKTHLLAVDVIDLPGNNSKLVGNIEVLAAQFPKQVGFSVSQEKLMEEKQKGNPDHFLAETLVKAIAESPKEKLWKTAFDLPMNVQKITTPFGERRQTPQKGKYLHKAIDLINFPRSTVWASNDGKVIVKDRFFMSGNTIVLDHGCGIFTLYYHLDSFASDISVGDFVKKGNPIGRLGKTGYSSGYHLHWEMRINNVAVDPLQWVENKF
ncbi:TPA: hypothetical protein DEO28_02270 [Candidatus Dependentiae bacterium]|nr:MAG: hypothetical protein UR14_C0008G0055 [candidate division TM6 bacterium GW2011_GWE2_31_21]KKP53219.1 MAG: hypothetical protein UR43_C0006G0002 [candidate division TM6 bacterium GW2011_GWF2_33_332]HBS48082.1 hypothetical protein [Candidatus Dependentiae bacterium]HBZ73315.1 hypothetical protein [Candidatus Dependentiae bacterium]